MRPRHRQDYFIRKPIAEKIHKQAENNGDSNERRIAVNLRKHPADSDDNNQKQAHQKPCFADIFGLLGIKGHGFLSYPKSS